MKKRFWPFNRRKVAVRGHGLSIRGFAAAQIDRLLSGWRMDGGFTSSEITTSLAMIRGRSRQMAKDSPLFKRWLNLSAVNIVGEGFALKSTPHDIRNGVLELDRNASKIIEYHWWKFCNYRDATNKQTYFDATGRKTESEMDRLNVKTWRRDGEYFIHVLRTNKNPYGISFRVLRPDWCDHTYNISDTGRGTLIQCGVEMDLVTRRPVAYWFFSAPKDAMSTNQRGQPLIKIPAGSIIHGFRQEDEDQPRGIPEGHAALRKLKMLDMYDEAELTAAREEACSVRTYFAPKGDEDAIADLTSSENLGVAMALTAEKEPGQSELLPLGWRSEVTTPQHPNKEVTAFKASMQKDVASGFNVEYSNFANDWGGVSFSSVRVGTISERDSWIVDQDDMISQCKSRQFLMWLESFLSLSVSGDLPVAKFDKFAEHEFRGRRWMWVDPVRDMKAAEVAVDRGWKTNTDVAADMGEDFEDNIEVLERENAARSGDKGDSVPALNGAQITAALEIVSQYSAGLLSAEPAIALMTAAGVPLESAQNMINKQTVTKSSGV